jgi:hypothetical protein
MGLYSQMLVRYMRFSIEELRQSMAATGIQADLTASPIFVDEKCRHTRLNESHRW